jgi:hypothetical protein
MGQKEGESMAGKQGGNRPVKTTIVLPEESIATLRSLAETRNVSLAEAVRRAVSIDKYITDARREGRRILVEDPEKTLTEIVIL